MESALVNLTKKVFFLLVFASSAIVLSSCSGSKELEQSLVAKSDSIAMLQREATSLRTENTTLKQRLNDAEQSNRSAIGRAAELETQIRQLQEELNAAKATKPPLNDLQMNDVDESYRRALAEFRNRNYETAAGLFGAILDKGPTTPTADNCTYWLGECSFAMRRYEEAMGYFEKVFAYEWSEKKDDSQIMIARTFARMGNYEKAREAYQRLVDKFPASPYVDYAKARLAKK